MKNSVIKYLSMAVAALLLCCCQKTDDILKVQKQYLNQSFNSNGGSIDIPVRSTATFTATLSEGASWCTAVISGQKVTLTVNPLTDGGIREATLTIASSNCKDIVVSIKQIAVVIADKPSKIELSSARKAFTLTITSAVELAFSYPEWITPLDDEWVSGTKAYVFTASDITEGAEDRSGKFTVKTKEGTYSEAIPVSQTSYSNPAIKTLVSLWQTDPFLASPLPSGSARYGILSTLEGYCQTFDSVPFKAYLAKTDSEAAEEEKDVSILSCYRYAFDRVLSEVQSTVVENGSAVIWMLYNSGFIVKTPSVCFGLDVNHRYASQLAPYLDFICVSHNDADHIDNALMSAMDAAGKPVLSNFHAGEYKKTSPTTYHIGDVKITTCISDESETELNTTTSHRIFLPEDAGNLQIFHEGDSQCGLQQMSSCLDGTAIDVMILRFGQVCEAGIIGTGSGQATPKYVLFSHLEELRHYNSISPMRATILGSISNMSRFEATSANGKIYVPFWGEKLIWKNGQLTK